VLSVANDGRFEHALIFQYLNIHQLAWGQDAPQELRCGQGDALIPFTKAGAVLKTVSNSNEPQAGQTICFSDFSFMLARMLCSVLQSMQRKS
jgi:hypothetical protein